MRVSAKMLYIISLYVLLSGILTGVENEKLKIAVIDLSSTGGLSPEESITLTNRLRSMIVRTEAFIVLERSKMEEILAEQGFQQTGCTSTECGVEMGRLLNVQKIISGSIGKIGNVYTIDMAFIDVQTAQIEKPFIQDHEGDIGGLLGVMELIANDIANTVRGGQQVEIQIKYGRLEVKTDPKKAEVYLDDNLIGPSPLKMEKLSVGSHTIQVKYKGFDQEERTVVIKENADTKLDIKLKEIFQLMVESEPAGAHVLINNKDMGPTPYKTSVKEGMKFELKVVKENYQEWKKQINVKDDIEYKVELKYTDAYKKALAAEKKKQEQQKAAMAAEKKKQEQQKAALTGEKKGSNTWLWIGGGALVAGGAAYYFLTRDTESAEEKLPLPVGRPE